MAYEYTELSTEERAQIAKAQVRQFEQEFFGHELNKQRAEALPDSTPGKAEQIKQADDASAIILSALTTTKTVEADLQAQAAADVAAEVTPKA